MRVDIEASYHIKASPFKQEEMCICHTILKKERGDTCAFRTKRGNAKGHAIGASFPSWPKGLRKETLSSSAKPLRV